MINIKSINLQNLELSLSASNALNCVKKIKLRNSSNDGWKLNLYIDKKDMKLFTNSIHNRITRRLREYYREIIILDYKFISKKEITNEDGI